MKRRLLLLLSFVINLSLFGQQLKPVAKKVNDLRVNKVAFEKLDLFAVDRSASKMAKYQKAADDAVVLSVKRDVLASIVAEKPVALEMTIPYEDGNITVELVKNDIFGGLGTLKVNTDKGEFAGYKPGVYYQGIIKGDVKSLVAFSFFEDNIVAIASDLSKGNIILGKATDSKDYVIYNEAKLKGENTFICETDKLMENQKQNILFDPKTSKAPAETQNCVRVFYEIANKPFIQNGSSIETTTDWISAVHNNIATLYTNDGVKTSLHEVFIWTVADPYTGNYSDNLTLFRQNRGTFNGDLAHLVNYPSTTSVAYLNSLCTGARYAYSGINMSYNNVPTYSWTIMAMTHEMGHALGSPHTHNCSWNGNGTAIDGCGEQAGYGEGCTGPIPTKGTIMSYCHLLGSVGINMALGFGEQPSALIRQTVDGKGCLNTDCQTGCVSTIVGFNLNVITENSVSAVIADSAGTEWKYLIEKADGTPVKSGLTTNKAFNVTGLEPRTYYILKIGGSCGSTLSYQVSRMFLTEGNWCGATFKDPGNNSTAYGNNINFSKTFIPTTAGDKIKLEFEEFDLEDGYDFLTVRNGPTTTSPIFSGGANMTGQTVGGPFQSTHSTGAITLIFRSDGGVAGKGWLAKFDCMTLGVDDVTGKSGIAVTPNPTNGPIKISSKSNINSVTIFDAEGKLLATDKGNVSRQHSVNLAKYPAGIYLVTITTETETITKKVIKK